MNIIFDHIVHLTQNPDQAMEAFKKIGFQAFTGGNHPNWGTNNCLCYFQDLQYIEWIGIKDIGVAKNSDNLLIQQIFSDSTSSGEGFSQLAFRTDNMDELAKKLTSKQLKVIGPIPGSRKRSDGTTLNWSMLFIKDDECRYPFFIQWGEFNEVRQKNMAELMEHRAGKTAISTIHIQSPDSGVTLKKFAHLFDEAQANSQNQSLQIGDVLLKFHLKDGPVKPFQCDLTTSSLTTVIEVCSGRYTLSKTV
ncbi:VOC family protein [Cytobacillus suaedae]|nr:VOC family protein [Cytobacillus suaedae]